MWERGIGFCLSFDPHIMCGTLCPLPNICEPHVEVTDPNHILGWPSFPINVVITDSLINYHIYVSVIHGAYAAIKNDVYSNNSAGSTE